MMTEPEEYEVYADLGEGICKTSAAPLEIEALLG